MTIYDIDREIERILMETDENGELPEEALDELMQLNEDRETKIENAACLVLDLQADAKKIREQEAALKQRRESLEKRADRIKLFLEHVTEGRAFASPRVTIRYTKSSAVEIDDDLFWEAPAEMFIRYKQPEADKTAIKNALKDGAIIPGARLVYKENLQIK